MSSNCLPFLYLKQFRRADEGIVGTGETVVGIFLRWRERVGGEGFRLWQRRISG